MERPTLALISPCYNEEDIIKTSYEKLNNILNNLKNKNKISQESFISFVDDGSRDKTWEYIKELNVKGIKLSKNFGHQIAIYAGLIENKADIYITLDVDLQDDLTVIEKMVDEYKKGNEAVYGVRPDRGSDNFFKKTSAIMFYKLNKFLKMNTIQHHADFRLISDKIVEVLRKNKEINIYLRGIIPNLGFKHSTIEYKRQERIGGTVKYNFIKIINLAIEGITSFSTVPLRIISILGLICFLFAIGMSLYALYSHLTEKIITGWTSLIISIYFLGGIQLVAIGVIGEYIGKIYLETKKRPIYIIEEKSNT